MHPADRAISRLRVGFIAFAAHGADIPAFRRGVERRRNGHSEAFLLEGALAIGHAGAVAVFGSADARLPAGMLPVARVSDTCGAAGMMFRILPRRSGIVLAIGDRDEFHPADGTFPRLGIDLAAFALHRATVLHGNLLTASIRKFSFGHLIAST
jgi:hypothetical protein